MASLGFYPVPGVKGCSMLHGLLLADARVWLKARFCWRKIRERRFRAAFYAGRRVFWLTPGFWLKARFCCAKYARSKAVSPRLLSQADGRVTFVWETKVTKNSWQARGWAAGLIGSGGLTETPLLPS